MSNNRRGKSNAWTHIKVQAQEYRDQFIEHVERRDKVYVALSGIAIAAFTFTLFLATFLLWWGAERNSERQLRAYVFPSEQKIANVITGQRPACQTVIKNTGLTPARNVVVWAGITVASYPIDRELKRATPEFLKTSSRRVVNPTGSFTIEPVWDQAITPQQMQLLQNGTAAVFCWGEITYIDVFGHGRTSSFRVYYGGDTGLRLDGFTTSDVEGNDAD